MPSAPTRSRSGRRPRLAARAGVAFVVLLVAAACGEVPEDATPTIPDIDFTPVLVLSLADGGLEVTDGPADLEPVGLDPPTVVGGSVLAVRNEGDDTARLRAGNAFDTLELRPGEQTVMVVTNDGSDDRRLPLDDGDGPEPDGDEGPLGTLVVTPPAR